MNKRYPTLAGLALGVILLGGCAAEAAAPAAPAPAASQGIASGSASSQTGTVDGTESGTDKATGTPPAAAAMVCSTEAKDNVTKILGLSAVPKTADSWNGTQYSCSYTLPNGTFAMSVNVFPAAQAATAGARTLAASLDAAPIKGLSNLGLPGYQSADGTVVFAKDNFALHVDSTKLAASVGVNHITRADFAYQMATTILACWSEH
ncbi:hypothetical protein CVV68_05700 [Arthrobacter livingstonensis]|uniref:DUF3558 domain-containing protein n=1 Tax=Arthrobacter livingstonensis TaxID=670078 RepID=A0A2V5LD07_9MICC|nr:hypothetical protein [Arthrobacter livingstonensis]PYI68782.1 hypothetical protein CVV68_05700 [Arthrobacter livingstonensis]